MKIKLIAALVAASIISSSSYAFFCPKNFNQINFGDSLAQVEQLCGPADKKVVKDASDNQPQEWNYFIPQQGNNNDLVNPQPAGSLKTSFEFDASGKLVNITVNGAGAGATRNCGSPITLGDSRKMVEAACGKPNRVNKQEAPPSTSNPADPNDTINKQVELIYSSTPPTTLIFEGNKLTAKQ
jgi:hypothetical protein